MIFDVILLVMRDADLWEDAATFVRKHTPLGLGSLILFLGHLLAGENDALGDNLFNKMEASHKKSKSATVASESARDLKWDEEPTFEEKAQVKRELTENCVVSEMMATMVLLVMILVDWIMHALGAPGYSSIMPEGTDNARRGQALAVYTVSAFCCFKVDMCVAC
jgi:hypothetical protein